MLYDTRVQRRNNLTQTGFERVFHNIEWFLMHPVLWEWKMNLLSASPIFHQFGQLFVKISIWMFQFGIGLAVHLSTAEFSSRLGFRASWTPVEVIDYIAKWWQIKSFLVCMIFTPQCLVSRCNLAKIDPINIKSKQLYSPHFRINYMYSLVKNTKYSFRKQNRNRLRVHVLLTSCSPGRNRAKHGDSREIKTKTSFTQVGTNSATDCSTFCTSP